jgi:dephospho-CoA kinase
MKWPLQLLKDKRERIKMIVIGLTGSIGMGKSTVANMLSEMGIPVHDSDAAVHGLLGPNGAAVAAVAAVFPEAARKNENGAPFIDRKALGRLVFSDDAKKKTLEGILHPLVRAQSDEFLTEMRKSGQEMAVLDIPLLFETGGEERVDVTLCVSAPPEVQRARVLQRPGMTAERFERVSRGQMPDAEKRARADYVIDTGCDIETTRARLNNVMSLIMKTRAHGKPP